MRHWERTLYLTEYARKSSTKDLKDLKPEILIWKTAIIQMHRESLMTVS